MASIQLLQQNDSWDATGSSCEGQRRSGKQTLMDSLQKAQERSVARARETSRRMRRCVGGDAVHHSFSYIFAAG